MDLTVYRDKYFKTEAKLVERRVDGRFVIGSRNGSFWMESAEPMSDDLRGEYQIDDRVGGLVITSVSPDSPYARQLVAGMVIENQRRAGLRCPEERLTLVGRKVMFIYIDGLSIYGDRRGIDDYRKAFNHSA